MAETLDDPFLVTLVARVIEPYRKNLAPAELEAVRDTLLIQLAAHPVLAEYVARLGPGPVVHESAALETGDAAAGLPTAARDTPRPAPPKKARGV